MRIWTDAPSELKAHTNPKPYGQILKQGRVFFSLWRLVRPSQDGERGERLTNTPFGAKDGGRHRQERALVLTSLRRLTRRPWKKKHARPKMFGAERVSIFATDR